MVREVRGYMCEICEEIYDTREQAVECENSHIETMIEPVYTIGEEYPVQLILKVIKNKEIVGEIVYDRRDRHFKND